MTWDAKVYMGAMHSEKTKSLIERFNEDESPIKLAVSPLLDTRHADGKIHSKAGSSIEAKKIDPNLLLLVPSLPEGLTTLYIDELQFFTNVKAFFIILREKGINVVAAGLDRDYLRQWWPEMASLHNFDGVKYYRLKARCTPCGEWEAVFTRRIVPCSSSRIDPGDAQYVPTCQSCWAPPPEV